ncbi:MAG TPA: glycosyltransferase [Bryobacteraceae bacterium]|nr:glycosyltransferase [Bryobacteraceae bacterium]
MNRKVTLLFVDAGGGHRTAAAALRDVIGRQRRPWDVDMVSMQDLFNPIDFIQRCTGIRYEEVYNILLRRGWTLGSAHMIRLMHLLIRMTHRSQVEVLTQYWTTSQPDLVVSLIPHFNRAIAESLSAACPAVPMATILTDIADYPPHFWIEPGHNVICGSEHAARQAAQLGARRIFRTSGMILNPAFHEPPDADRRCGRATLGLQPDLPTGLVLFGGEGSNEMLQIAHALNQSTRRLQLILLCGKNDLLARELRAIRKHIPMSIHGFTRDVPWFMELADFFIGKPGPGSISEALAKQLPVIVQRNAWTLAHERYNTQWIEEKGLGLVVRNFEDEIGAAVDTLLAPKNYESFRRRVSAIHNRAVYETPDVLEELLSYAPCAPETIPASV